MKGKLIFFALMGAFMLIPGSFAFAVNVEDFTNNPNQSMVDSGRLDPTNSAADNKDKKHKVDDEGSAQNLIVAPAGETKDSITIVWDKPKHYDDVIRYKVYMNGKYLSDQSNNKTYYTAENLKPGKKYSFSVAAVYNDGRTPSTKTITGKTDPKGRVINVLDYHAAGDGTTKDTAAIQKAIDAAPRNGTVLIPEGYTFLTGALDLKSNMTLQVDGTLLGSKDAEDYLADGKLILTRFEGWELNGFRSLINVGHLNPNNREEVTAENVTVRGKGEIRGGGSTLASAMNDLADKNKDVWNVEDPWRTRGRLISFIQSKNINLSGLKITKSPCWTVHMIYCDTVTTYGVDVTSDVRNGDGWDPDSSKNLMLFDSKFDTGDDCVAIKSGKNPDTPYKVNIPTKNVKIFDITCSGNGLGLAIGSEISGGVSNVSIRDTVVMDTRYGLELKATNKRGGYIKDLTVQDSTLNRVLVHRVGYNDDGEPAPDRPIFSDMMFKNVHITGTDSSGARQDRAIELVGFHDTGDDIHDDTAQGHGKEEHYLHDLVFKNVTLGTKESPLRSILLEYSKDIEFNNTKQLDGRIPDFNLGEDVTNIQGEQDTPAEFTDVVEAEAMGNMGELTSRHYIHNDKEVDYASNGYYRYIDSEDNTGTLAAKYMGKDGVATINVNYYDLESGSASYELFVNGVSVDSWTATDDKARKPSSSSAATKQINGVTLKKGDEIRLTGKSNGSDTAPIDKLSVSVAP